MTKREITISVVTVCYNAENYIQETILSVLGQTYQNVEYIIVDGKSADHTFKIISNYVDEFKMKNRTLILISEPDSGIYNAMNKAINNSNGDYIMFLNAGDVLADRSTLYNLSQKIDEDTDIIYGNHYARIKDKRKLIIPSDLSHIYNASVFCHQASLTKLNILKENIFDESYSLLADYDFFIKQFLNGKKFQYVDLPVVYYSLAGVSQRRLMLVKKESILIRKKYGLLLEKDMIREHLKMILYIIRKTIIDHLPFRIRTYQYNKINTFWYNTIPMIRN